MSKAQKRPVIDAKYPFADWFNDLNQVTVASEQSRIHNRMDEIVKFSLQLAFSLRSVTGPHNYQITRLIQFFNFSDVISNRSILSQFGSSWSWHPECQAGLFLASEIFENLWKSDADLSSAGVPAGCRVGILPTRSFPCSKLTASPL